MSSIVDSHHDVAHAIQEIYETYGDLVSVDLKRKSLDKFGTNTTVGTSWETVAQLQGTTANETFVSTNIIDSIASTNELADVGITVTIEGHTIDTSGNLTFVAQNATLHATDARTEVTLTTPLARANRAYIANSGTFDSPQAVPTGIIYIYDNTDGQTNGVPTTAAATKLLILAGETQTQKAATSISSSDYFIVTGFGGNVASGAGSAGEITLRLEIRDVANGGVWRPITRDKVIVVGAAIPPTNKFDPFKIIPKNHDVRIRAFCDSNSAAVQAHIEGYLAKIVT